jgi:hypothetical protein
MDMETSGAASLRPKQGVVKSRSSLTAGGQAHIALKILCGGSIFAGRAKKRVPYD